MTKVYGTSTTYGSDDELTLDVDGSFEHVFLVGDPEDPEGDMQFTLRPDQADTVGDMLKAAARAIREQRNSRMEAAAE